ncbi:polygalacturonase 1 beta-like protein 3 [Ziziphus jujuba]|uniref:Polygalacturonase 1 beta-like protein 3 n=1 Tax=Ziziphus jujuba TaxID=326968 RepID=A0ABM4A010_ZIZJJ|nr:polygalacturonase 1 beta-like protein 3 [Ziziphus jujuba]
MNVHFLLFFYFVFFILSSLNVSPARDIYRGPQTNPFSPKAYAIRYWNRHISDSRPEPPGFLISKASPLNAIDSTFFANLTFHNSLSSYIHSFCSLANLFCSFDDHESAEKPHSGSAGGGGRDSNFAVYSNKNFAEYGSSRRGGADSFKNYSDGLNSPNDSFKKYSRSSTSHAEQFTNYATDSNVATADFAAYGSQSTGGSGEFSNYHRRVNVPNLQFTSYDSDAKGHRLNFATYSDDTNSGSETFISYGKNGNGDPSEFIGYAENANIVGSGFTGYGESGNGANDSFKGYGLLGNNPHSNFKGYGLGGNSGIDSFSNYRNGANVGDDSFQSYARNSNSGKVSFVNYGKSFSLGNDSFKEYGKGSVGRTTVGFQSYSLGRTFKDYNKKGLTFSEYNNFSTQAAVKESGRFVNKRVEPGKFFRESELKQGKVMVMPDIRDRMPKRSFLPRTILSKLPFSTSKISELNEIFDARENSAMQRVITNALTECERSPSRGETKRCVGSLEDMVDFAVTVLGRNVVVRTTANVNGSKRKVMIGKVKGVNGGNVTKSVSCHQSLYPYLLYYCHSVPRVRVYEADIHDAMSNMKINHGVAICHLDTSSWSPLHGAFVALGSSPGQIEVCHWIFENDMSWTTTD